MSEFKSFEGFQNYCRLENILPLLSEANLRVVWKANNRNELIDTFSSIEDETGIKPNRFIKIFSDTKKSFEYQSKLIRDWELKESFLTFSRKYRLILDEEPLEGIIFSENLPDHSAERIATIKNGKITLNHETGQLYKLEYKIREYIVKSEETEGKERKKIIENIGNSKRKLKKEKNELRKQITKTLNNTNSNSNSNILEGEVWNKDIKNTMTHNDFECSAFLGYHHAYPATSIYSYMSSPAVQLLKARLNDNKAVAINVAARDILNDDKVLLVDSVESASHMLARKKVSEGVDSLITDYGTNSGFDILFYSLHARNSAPKEFLNNISHKYKRKTLELELMKEQNVYLDIFHPDGNCGYGYKGKVTGYVVEL